MSDPLFPELLGRAPERIEAPRICPTCGFKIEADDLVCRNCVKRQSEEALRAYQREPLRQILAGEGELVTRAIQRKRHLQMFGADRTFCGLKVSAEYRRGFIPYDPAELRSICAGCRDELMRAMAEVEQSQ